MLRRIIASIVVLTVLGYGTAWAFAGHVLEVDGHAADGIHEDTQAVLDEGGCDHCCHAAAHMTGMAPPMPTFHYPDADTFRADGGCTAATLSSAPPLRPPRS